jgi:arylsulfatase A-like enzyme
MGAMIQDMDNGVGCVLDKLDELGLTDNTIFVFFSDNGGNMYDQVEQSTPTNNLPLRSGKGNIHEGGVRVPLIVAWPGVVDPGTKSQEIVSSIDLYPTFLEIAGIQPNGEQVIDGESIMSVLRGEGPLQREAIYCHFPHTMPATYNLPSTSVRKGDWKLIRFYGEGENRTHAHSLYNLKEDIGETNDLAERYPDLVIELDGLIERHLKETGSCVPVLNSAYVPSVPVPWKGNRQSIKGS